MPATQKKKASESQTETKVVEEVMEKAPSLTMPRFGLAAEVRNIWRVSVPSATLPEQVMEESFWSNVARLLQPGDEIQILPDSFSWRRDVFVLASGSNWAQVCVLDHYDLTPSKAHQKVPSKYKVEFAGSHHKWRVLREGEPMKDGFASEKIAYQWAANHEAAVNR
jgi:hypothetical protein